jgi:hypothetical protein
MKTGHDEGGLVVFAVLLAGGPAFGRISPPS